MKIKRRDFLKGAAGSLALAALDGQVAQARTVQALPPDALGILFDSTLCVGCNACMSACKKANSMQPDFFEGQETWDKPQDLTPNTLNVIKKFTHGSGEQKDNEIDGYAFIKRQCLHCVDPSCVTACPVSALVKDKNTGIVTYNKDACIGCRYCQVACPYNIPKFDFNDVYPEIVKCQLCNHLIKQGDIPACCSVCPTGASLFGKVTDLIEETRRRQQMQPGKEYDYPVTSIDSGTKHTYKAPEYVPHVYGKEELGGTQVMYMSAVGFENFGLPAFPKESFVSMSSGIQYAIYKGMVYPLVVLAGLVFMVKKHKNQEEVKPAETLTDKKEESHE
jgi:Fe-S-cluster-containing dehydrogenase component